MRVRRLPLLGLLLSGWAALPPFVGPRLAALGRAELADHVVPAFVLLAVALVALWATSRPDPGVIPMTCALVASLSGLWMVATHLPLVVQVARTGVVSWLAVAHHGLPGVAVLGLGLAWTALAWPRPVTAG